MKLVAPFVATLAVVACTAGGSLVMRGAIIHADAGMQVPDWQATHVATRVCSDFRRGHMHCDALILKRDIRSNVAAWGPANFQAAYNLPSSSKGRGQIVAIVDAFDNPNVASDLATYRANFGLRAAHFTKYNAKGETRDYPSPQQGWAFEEDL